MNHSAIKYKDILMSIISRQKENLTCFACNPDKDFSRTRKLPYEKLILSLLTLEGASLSNELLRQFGCDCTTATSSAFVQQRKKLFVSAMENLFQTFISETDESKCFNGLRLSAVDGSDIQIPTNPEDEAYNNMALIQEKGWKYLIRTKKLPQ